MSEGIRIGPGVVITADQLQWNFSTSGGPGGQHANRSATRAVLTVDLGTALPPDVAETLIVRLGRRVKDGRVSVSVDDTRSQSRNREIARNRMAALLADALSEPEPRQPTKPPRAAKERRLRKKRLRSEIKKLRKRPSEE